MTVREFITQLQKLDQDKNIWQLYDPPYAAWEPEVDIVQDYDAGVYDDNEVKVGDYALIAS